MNLRTDLAIEQGEIHAGKGLKGIEHTVKKANGVTITEIRITDKDGETALKRKKGRYITVEIPRFSKSTRYFESGTNAVAEGIKSLIPQNGPVLVAGLGNENITPDALGPRCASLVFSTRHISKEIQKNIGIDSLRSVSRITPGVLGQNGIETSEILAGIIRQISPAALITVDALASRRLSRLGCTVQICNTGITPGSGVGNSRAEISESTMGVPVIAVGVPTVVDAATLAHDLTGASANGRHEKGSENMMVTPREIDVIIDRAAKLIATAINSALQPNLSTQEISALIS